MDKLPLTTRIVNKVKEEYGDIRIYFQPPPNIMMVYPCSIVHIVDMYKIHADNNLYANDIKLEVVYMTEDPNDPMIENIISSKNEFQSMMTVDGLYHVITYLYL